jgi:hypothetical protein
LTVHSTGGAGHSSPARSNACSSTRASKLAESATSTRPRSRSASCGSTTAGGGAASTIACEIPVKRWMPRDSGAATPTSELHSSCSSPPPTSTAPTSVSSQRSPGSPFVSVSTARNSAEARGSSSTDPPASAPNRTYCTIACATFRSTVRRPLLLVAATVAIAGCGGGEPRANLPRPPAPATISAAIHDSFVQVSPRVIGGGPIRLLVANLSSRPQRVTFESADSSTRSGLRASTRVIPPQGTGGVTLDAVRGRYVVRVDDRAVRAARVRVGPRRRSSQNQLLLP